MTKDNKKTNNTPKPKRNRLNGIMGILELFVVASVAYSTAVIAMGTEGYLPLVLVAPQTFWAIVKLVKKFAN